MSCQERSEISSIQPFCSLRFWMPKIQDKQELGFIVQGQPAGQEHCKWAIQQSNAGLARHVELPWAFHKCGEPYQKISQSSNSLSAVVKTAKRSLQRQRFSMLWIFIILHLMQHLNAPVLLLWNWVRALAKWTCPVLPVNTPVPDSCFIPSLKGFEARVCWK